MDKRLLAIIIGLIIVVVGLGYLYQTVPPQSEIINVKMINNKGEDIGYILVSETRAGILLNMDLNDLGSGSQHAIHIHEKGDCTPLATFANAGGHFNPSEQAHGMKHPEGAHAGDMPNLVTDAVGGIKAQIMNSKLTLMNEATPDGRVSVLDADGSAIVIHAKPDDHMSQPSGAAGDRIACGVITK
jgi:Cu-Zn family superoxide dismutase